MAVLAVSVAATLPCGSGTPWAVVTPSLVAMREPSGPMTEARVELAVALAQAVSLVPR